MSMAAFIHLFAFALPCVHAGNSAELEQISMLQARVGRHESSKDGPSKDLRVFGTPPTPAPPPLPAGFKPPFKLQENLPMYKCFKPFAHHESGFMFVPPMNKKPGMISVTGCSSACARRPKIAYWTTANQNRWHYVEKGYEKYQSFYVVPGAKEGTVSFKTDIEKDADKYLVVHKKGHGKTMQMMKVDHAEASYPLNLCPLEAAWGELPMGRCVAMHQIDSWSVYVHFKPALNGSKDHVSFGTCTGKVEHPRDTPEEFYFQMYADFYHKYPANSVDKGQMLSWGAKPGKYWVKGDSTDKAALTRASFKVVKGVQPDDGNSFSFIDWKGRYLTGGSLSIAWGEAKGGPAIYTGDFHKGRKLYNSREWQKTKVGFGQSWVMNKCCPIYQHECKVNTMGPAYKFTAAPTPAPPTPAPPTPEPPAAKPEKGSEPPVPEGGCDCK